MVPRSSYEISRVSHYSGYCHVSSAFAYRTFTFFGLPSQVILLTSLNQFRSPLPHKNYFLWFGLFPFRSPLLWKSIFLSLPVGTKMFQFPTFPFIYYFTHIWIIRLLLLIEFPHSDIHGLSAICAYPWLFAAYHVLLRLLMPRHSPYALSSLTFFILNLDLVNFLKLSLLVIILVYKILSNFA